MLLAGRRDRDRRRRHRNVHGHLARRARPGHGGGFRRSPAQRGCRSRPCAPCSFPHAAIVTPQPARSCGNPSCEDVAQDEETMRDRAGASSPWAPSAVLIKGGHGSGAESTDLSDRVDQRPPLPGPAQSRRRTRTAPAARFPRPSPRKLAQGTTLAPPPFEAAKAYISAAIAAGRDLDVSGHGAWARCRGFRTHRRWWLARVPSTQFPQLLVRS